MFGYDIYDFVECTEKECYVLENKWFAGYILFEINRMTKKNISRRIGCLGFDTNLFCDT